MSIVEALSYMREDVIETQLSAIRKGHTIYINDASGYNFNIIPEFYVLQKTISFPHWTEKDIRIKQWGEEAKGSHYYAYVGDVEVHDGDIIKWDSFQEAYDVAKRYIS